MEIDMTGNSLALKTELAKLTRDRNRMTLTEFHEFLPLFRNNWQELVTTEEMAKLSIRWGERVSLFDKVEVVRDFVDENGNIVVAFTLPPMFTRLNSLNDGNQKADTIVTIFDNALTKNSPLRTDVEKALVLMKKAINVAQAASKERLQRDIREYHEIMDNLKGVLSSSDETENEDDTTFNTEDLDWE